MIGRARGQFCSLLFLFAMCQAHTAVASAHEPGDERPWKRLKREDGIADSRRLKVGRGILQVDFAPGALDLPEEVVLLHIQAAASAVTQYYGQFPVSRARVLVVPV